MTKTHWRELALLSAVVVAAMGYFFAVWCFVDLPPPPSEADAGRCASYMIENRDISVGPEKCAAYVKPISVLVRSREGLDSYLLLASSFTVKVDTTVRIKKEIGRGEPWPGIICIFPHRSSYPDNHVFVVGEEVAVIQHLRMTYLWFWGSQWRCDSDTG